MGDIMGKEEKIQAKKDRLVELIVELTTKYNLDENAFMKKAEESFKLFAELFVENKLEGKDTLNKMKFNRKPSMYDALASTSAKTGEVTINSGFLKAAGIRERIDLYAEMLLAVEHEYRHSFQVEYGKLLEQGDKADKEKLEMYKRMFEDTGRGEEIARSARDRLSSEEVVDFMDEFYVVAHPEAQKELNYLISQLQNNNDSLYWASLHEIDARRVERTATVELNRMVTSAAAQAQILKIFGGGKANFDLGKGLAVAKEFIHKLIQMSRREKQIQREDAVDAQFFSERMIMFNPNDVVQYARAIEGNSNREEMLYKILNKFNDWHYVRDIIKNPGFFDETIKLLDEQKLSWAADEVEKYIGWESDNS